MMNKQVILLAAAFSFAFLTGCGGQNKQPGEEFYDADYRAKADSAYEENQRNRPAMTQAQTANPDTNSEQVGANASTHSAASEAPAAQNDKSQASAPGKTAGTTPNEGRTNAGAAPAQTKPAAAGGGFEKGKELIADRKSDV